MRYIDSEEFLRKARTIPVIDVRSPGEFTHGHIPGAVNIPLFTDEERAIVGTNYKKQGRKYSIRKGLELIGPKMAGFVKEADKLQKGEELLIHCWRGGMRSGSMAWLMETAGFTCDVLDGGYKAYRKYVRGKIAGEKKFIVLGGLTGSGKTILLNEIREKGEPVVDLEGLANHKGSAFGGIGQEEQPTTEQFENDLFDEISRIDKDYFWVEDESLQIGKVFIPDVFHKKMRNSPVLFIDVPDSYRIDILLEDYADQDIELLEEAILKVEQRLGNLAARSAIDALRSGDKAETARILLTYYDKTYKYGLSKKRSDNVHRLDLNDKPRDTYSDAIIKQTKNLLNKSN